VRPPAASELNFHAETIEPPSATATSPDMLVQNKALTAVEIALCEPDSIPGQQVADPPQEPKEPEAKEPDPKEPDPREPDPKVPEAKEPEAKVPEAKEPEAKEPEAKEPEAKEPEAKEPESEPKDPPENNITLEERRLDPSSV